MCGNIRIPIYYTIYSNNLLRVFSSRSAWDQVSVTLFSQKSRSEETDFLPSAVGNASPNCHVSHDAFWLCIALSISFGSKSELNKRERRFKVRVLIPIILLFPVSTIKNNNIFSSHLSLTNICRDVISRENDQHWTESVNSQKAAKQYLGRPVSSSREFAFHIFSCSWERLL